MAIPNQQNVTQRQVVNTIEDKSKYDTPNSRRLRVNASPLRMNVEAGKTSTFRLAEALAEVEPELSAVFNERTRIANNEQLQLGIRDRIEGLEDPTMKRNAWREYGYDYEAAYLQGEELGVKLEADLQTKEPTVPFDQWYEQWWGANGQDSSKVSAEHSITFNKTFGKALEKVQRNDAINVANLKFEEQSAMATTNMMKFLNEQRGKQLPVTSDMYEVLKTNYRDRFTNSQIDGLFFNALGRYALENNDIDSLNVLYEKRLDENGNYLPAIIDNPKYTQKIVDLRLQVKAKKVSDINRDLTTTKALIKQKTDVFEEDMTLRRIEILRMKDPLKQKEAWDELWEQVQDNAEELDYSKGFLTSIEKGLTGLDEDDATAEMHGHYRVLVGRYATIREFTAALERGEINQKLWDKGVTKVNTLRSQENSQVIRENTQTTKFKEYDQAAASLKALVAYDPRRDRAGTKGSIKKAYEANTMDYFNRTIDKLEETHPELDDVDLIMEAQKLTEEYMVKKGYLKGKPLEARKEFWKDWEANNKPKAIPKTEPNEQSPAKATMMEEFERPSNDALGMINEDPVDFFMTIENGKGRFRYWQSLPDFAGIKMTEEELRQLQTYFLRNTDAKYD